MRHEASSHSRIVAISVALLFFIAIVAETPYNNSIFFVSNTAVRSTTKVSLPHRQSRMIYNPSYKQNSISKNYLYSQKFHPLEFGGEEYFSSYPFRTTVLLDPFNIHYLEDIDQVKAKLAQLHAMGIKVILYKPFSSLSEVRNFIEYWNLSIKDIAPMDLNGTYYVARPYKIGYEGRDKWREFFINFTKLIFDAGFDGIEFDGGDGLKSYGSFDPETMQKFNQYLASKYNATELKEKFNISDINSFNFTEYLRELGYHHNKVIVDTVIIAHPGLEGPKDNEYAKALWKEFLTFNLKMLLELYKLLWENVQKWEQETGREFYISTRVGFYHYSSVTSAEENDMFFLQYADALNWEYTWPNYPNRTASEKFRIVQSLNKTFNPWIVPWSSLEATGFTEWFSNGWNKTMDPEEQYLGFSEIVVCGGRVPISTYGANRESDCVNKTHFAQFIRLVQENPHLFGQSQFGEVALIYPVATAININELNITSVFMGSFDSYEGAFYLLADSHRAFDIIVFGDDNWVNITPSLSQLLKYKAIVLSGAVCLSDNQVNLLKQYLENGGIIIGIGEIATHNQYGEPVNREFANYFDGGVHTYGSGLIVSIKNVSTSDYLLLRTQYDPNADAILEAFINIFDKYAPREIQTDLPTRAHIYRFFNFDENALIFHIINFNYDFEADKVIRAFNISFSFKLPPQLRDKQLAIRVYSEDYPEGIEVPYNLDPNTDFVSIIIPKVSILTSIEVRPKFEHPEPTIINKPTIYSNEIITLDRDLIVNSSLVLLNSQIRVVGGVRPIKIEVLSGGSLTIINSRIYKESGNYYIVARKGSKIFINASDISGAGLFGTVDKGGICIETDGAVIINSIIHDNYDFGILICNASHALIGNNVFSNNSIGCALVRASYIDFFNNTVVNNAIGILTDRAEINDIGIMRPKLMKRGIIPYMGLTKIDISNSVISNNTVNIAIRGSNFVTVKGVDCGNGFVNILVHQSNVVKICNSSIYSGWIGIHVEECPATTILGNRIYNNSHIGIKLYKCYMMQMMYWLCLEGGSALCITRIIGNYIQNNFYGIHMEIEHGPSEWRNDNIQIADNEFRNNTIGIYANASIAIIYENNFIGNKIHAKVGKAYSSVEFYLNYSYPSGGVVGTSASVGNYWDDYNGDGSEPYQVTPNRLDYYPLTDPVEIPVIKDFEGPYVLIKNATVKLNETGTGFYIIIEYNITDKSYIVDSKYSYAAYALIHMISPNMIKGIEFPWLGYSEGLIPPDLGPEGKAKSYEGVYNFGEYACNWQPMPIEWLERSMLAFYCTDIWGNWNKNDTVPPYAEIVLRTPIGRNERKIFVFISDWSEISKAQLMYLDGSIWKTAKMIYDHVTHLYYAELPQVSGGLIRYKIYVEDIYGNSFVGKEYYTDIVGPTITDVSHIPQEPTDEDTVKVIANITDPSGVSYVILSYSTDQVTWYNVSMIYNETTGLYEATIPAMPANATVYYKIYANDTYGNWAWTTTYSYKVKAVPGQQPSPGQNYFLYIAVAIIIGVVISTVIFVIRKR